MNKDSKAVDKFLKWANDLGFSEAPKEEAPLLTGWICPRCGKVHSPFSTNCDCPPQSFTSTGVSTISTLESSQKEPAEVSEVIPSDVVSKMQHEFQPKTTTSFEQGMYSGYAFGLQDGFKYAKSLPQSQKTESADVEKFAQILGKCCLDNKVNLTSNERHTVYDAFKQYAQSYRVSQEARPTELLNPDDFISIDIDVVREKWNNIFNVPNNGWAQIERDLLTIKDKVFPLTLRTYLINKIPYCVMIWMREQLIPKK